jgi:hypothetical protein
VLSTLHMAVGMFEKYISLASGEGSETKIRTTFRLKCTRHNYLSYQRRLKMDDFLLMSVMKQIMFQVLFNQKRAVFFISGPFPATTEAV